MLLMYLHWLLELRQHYDVPSRHCRLQVLLVSNVCAASDYRKQLQAMTTRLPLLSTHHGFLCRRRGAPVACATPDILCLQFAALFKKGGKQECTTVRNGTSQQV